MGELNLKLKLFIWFQNVRSTIGLTELCEEKRLARNVNRDELNYLRAWQTKSF